MSTRTKNDIIVRWIKYNLCARVLLRELVIGTGTKGHIFRLKEPVFINNWPTGIYYRITEYLRGCYTKGEPFVPNLNPAQHAEHVRHGHQIRTEKYRNQRNFNWNTWGVFYQEAFNMEIKEGGHEAANLQGLKLKVSIRNQTSSPWRGCRVQCRGTTPNLTFTGLRVKVLNTIFVFWRRGMWESIFFVTSRFCVFLLTSGAASKQVNAAEKTRKSCFCVAVSRGVGYKFVRYLISDFWVDFWFIYICTNPIALVYTAQWTLNEFSSVFLSLSRQVYLVKHFNLIKSENNCFKKKSQFDCWLSAADVLLLQCLHDAYF